MEERELNISFYKAENGEETRLTLPNSWPAKLGITKENKTIELVLDEKNEQLVIRKKK